MEINLKMPSSYFLEAPGETKWFGGGSCSSKCLILRNNVSGIVI